MTIHFNKEDFEQLEFKLVFLNLTSSTQCKFYKNIKIEEILPESMTISLPKNQCNNGHSTMILFYHGHQVQIPQYISMEGKGKEVYFSVTGKISSKINDVFHPDKDIIQFKFIQYDKEQWESLLGLIKDRQLLINSTMDSIKIYG